MFLAVALVVYPMIHKAKPRIHKKHTTKSQTYQIFCLPLQQDKHYISMEEYLIISNANFLLRVASEQIAYVCSEGSYCTLRLTNGDEYTFSFNLVVFEKKIVEQLAKTAHFFARVGRNYIINSQHIFSINLNTSELVLYNERFTEKFTLHVSKEPLKQLKAILDNAIK